ncbi:fimbrial protein [Trinickia terrae]|uniref:Fimbrial protein n=1 Tax=Trinickia terrae TaxID=2571161 RepID=A0A4U1I001_9BURK|nr:AAA family ATPase [Trinickia terrae]TKC86256.1 fimbrial protein [Trinickia terrae]
MNVAEHQAHPEHQASSQREVDFLAIVADEASASVINNLILDQHISHAQARVGTFNETIALIEKMEHPPRQLIVDVSDSAMPLSDLTRLAQVCDPSVAVIAIGKQNDVGLFRNLLRIGVQDYVVKPLTADLLRRSLTANEPVMQVRMGKVLGLAGARGGVGVTTIGVALARRLAGERRRVVYLDLNLHGGSACSQLDLPSNNGLIELLEFDARPEPQSVERMLVSKGGRLAILSGEHPYGSEVPIRTGAVAEIIDTLKRHFHYVLVDVPARAGRLTDEALHAANHVYLVADRSVHGAHECARLVRFVQELPGERSVSVLLNNPLEPVAGRVSASDFGDAFGRLVACELPYDPKALAFAENLGEPVNRGRQHSGFRGAIDALVREMTGAQHTAKTTQPWYASLLKKPGRSA